MKNGCKVIDYFHSNNNLSKHFQHVETHSRLKDTVQLPFIIKPRLQHFINNLRRLKPFVFKKKSFERKSNLRKTMYIYTTTLLSFKS